MKKIILSLIFLPSLAYGAGEGLRSSISPYILLRTTNTWTGGNTFNGWTVFSGSVTFKDGSMTINGVDYEWPSSLVAGNCLKVDGSGNLSWGTCGSGGGGGGGSGVTFQQGGTLAATTTAYLPINDFNLIWDGVSASTITVKDSTGTWTAPQAFTRNTSFHMMVFIDTSAVIVGSMTVYGSYFSTGNMTVKTSSASQLYIGGIGSDANPTLAFTNGTVGTTNFPGIRSDGSSMFYSINGTRLLTMDSTSMDMQSGMLLLLAGGSAAAPPLAFTSSQSMGMYAHRFAPDALGFAMGGRPAIIINNLRKIGTTGKIGGADFYISTVAANAPIVWVGSHTVYFEVNGDSANFRNQDVFFSSPVIVTSSFTMTEGTFTAKGISYLWPAVEPTANQVLQSDADNKLSWATVSGSGDGVGSPIAVYDRVVTVSSPTFFLTISSNQFNTNSVGVSTATIALSTASATRILTAPFSGGGSAITASSSTVFTMSYDAIIDSITIVAPIEAGEIRMDVKKLQFDSIPGTFLSICGTDCPSLSGSTQKLRKGTLGTQWDRVVRQNDTYMVNVATDATGITNATVQLYMRIPE